MRNGFVWAKVCFMVAVVISFGLHACSSKDSSDPSPLLTTHSITGTVTLLGTGLQGVTMTLSSSTTVTTDSNGDYSFTGLSNGSYTITASKSGDTFSPINSAQTVNNSNITGVNFTATDLTTPPQLVDTEAPSAPTNLLVTGVTTSQINLSWHASTDNEGVAGYQIWRGGATISIVTGTSYSDTGLASNTTYTYAIKAFDKTGNLSLPSSAILAATFPNFGTWVLKSSVPTEIMDYTASVTVNEYIYVYKGGGWHDYWRYSTTDNSWQSIAPIQSGMDPYFNLTWLDGDQIYTFAYSTGTEKGLWQYSISNNLWSQLSSYPGGTVYGGAYAVGVHMNNENLIYALAAPDNFWKYSITNDKWTKMTTAPPFESVMLSVENNYIYGIHIGSNNWWRYSLSDDTLITLSSAPVVFETTGAKLARSSGDNIYAIRNGTYDYVNHAWMSTSDFWRYSISRNEWFSLDPLPKGVPSDEGALSSVMNGLYLIIGGPESAVYFLPIN